ncbi:MAG: MATE family efflux transporter [Deltaproteobacteria bacterium]|nr:MATE family efflux transporter [Deltaproteobacteria bacterium]
MLRAPVTSATDIRAELGALWKLAGPLAIASAGWALMGVVDTAVAGRAGPAVLGGTGLGNGLFFAVTVVGIGITMGLDPLVAQALGAGDRPRARRLLWQGVWLSLVVSAALAVPVALLPLALEPAGVDSAAAVQAGRFLHVRLLGLPAVLLFTAQRAYLQGFGRTRPLVLAAVLGNLANLPLAALLVFGGSSLPAWTGVLRRIPPLGSAGSATATTVVTVLEVALLALATREPGAAPVDRRPDRQVLRQALRVGLPIGLHMAAEVGIFALVGLLAGRLGAVSLGAHQLVLSVATLSFTLAIGIGNAASVRVGWAVGAGDTPAARRAGLTAFASAGSAMALAGLAFVLVPGPLARLFTDDPAVAHEAAALFVVAAVFQISDGLQGSGAGVLRGAGDTRFTFGANMVGHWLVGLPVALLLGFGLSLGVRGLWWGLCTGLSVVAGSLLWRFLRLSRRTIRPLAAAEQA